jgi:alpha-L-arabinofuranosidase
VDEQDGSVREGDLGQLLVRSVRDAVRPTLPPLVAALGILAAACGGGAPASPAVAEPPPPGRATASVSVDASRPLGVLSSRLFGANIDFNWNANGMLREDGKVFPQVLSALQALGMPNLRAPGGSSADTYDWKKGVGPGRHGYGAEYGFGTPEFLALLDSLGAEGLMIANFGTGTPELMAGWMRDIAKSSRRVTTWEIGNEIYGEWEKGHTDAADYAKRFASYASAARAADPKAKLALVLAPTMKGGGQDYEGWNETVLPAAGGLADVASVHVYSPWHDFFKGASRDTSVALMAAPEFWEAEIAKIRAALATTKGASGKPLELWITEWNAQHGDDHDWKQRSVTAEQMVFAADMIRVFAEQGVVVAQYYNLFGPYWGLFDRQGATDDLRSMLRLRFPPKRRPEDFRLVVRPAAHLFDLYRPLREGTRIATSVEGPSFSSRKYGSVPPQSAAPALTALAVRETRGATSIVLVNRSLETTLETSVRLAAKPDSRAELLVMGGAPLDANNEDASRTLSPRPAAVRREGDQWKLELPPASVARLRVGPPDGGGLVLP